DFVAAEPVLATTKVLALNPQYLMQIFEDVLRVGQAADRYEVAVCFKNQLLRRYEQVLKTGVPVWPPQTERPRVAVLEWTEPLMGAGNWTPELVQAAGGQPLFGCVGEHSTYIGWLDVVAARPEVLIVAPCGFNLERSIAEARRLLNLPGYRDLP